MFSIKLLLFKTHTNLSQELFVATANLNYEVNITTISADFMLTAISNLTFGTIGFVDSRIGHIDQSEIDQVLHLKIEQKAMSISNYRYGRNFCSQLSN